MSEELDLLNGSVIEFRQNPVIRSEFALVTTAASRKPKVKVEPVPYDDRSYDEKCPLCVGNEDMTPPEKHRVNGDNGQWALRVVDNKFPVLNENGNMQNFRFGLNRVVGGYGIHELMIDHPNHGIRIHDMSVQHLALLFSAYRHRMSTLYNDHSLLQHVLVFKNFGRAAGGSMAHTHSQFLGMPTVLTRVDAEMRGAKDFYDNHRECITCAIINESKTLGMTVKSNELGTIVREIKPGDFIVDQSEHFIAIAPFASRHEHEVHIFPKKHDMDFILCNEIDDLAILFQRVMARLHAVVPGLNYNYQIQSLRFPIFPEHSKSYHWYLEIIPRMHVHNGIEVATGLRVNTVAPEDAAEQLRNVQL